ncbi:MAG TPA: hypothetical protein ENN17_03320, partial [bacterium]|nr:hypothetical protein [bacterium]
MKKHGRRPGKENKPLQDAPDSSGKRFAWAIIPAGVLSAGILAGYRLFVRPELIRFSQKPVFFSDGYFLRERLRIPGGFLDYVAAYLTDLYRIEWLGAAILAGLALLTAFLLYVLFRPGRRWFAPILPALLLVSLQARYDFPVVRTLSLILALEGFILYRDALSRKPGTRFVSALALLVPIYLLSPGAMLLWVALCVLYELLNPAGSVRMRILLPLGFVSAGFVLPGLAAAGLYLVPVREAYFHHALFLHAGKIYAPGAVLAGSILILAAGFFLLRKQDREKTIHGRTDLIQGVSVLLSVFLVAAAGLRIREERKMLTIRHAAHQGAWKKVVSRIDARTVQDPLCLFHVNRALYHTGAMGSRFFTIPQHFGHYGLFLHKDLGYQYPLDLSDFFF